MPPVYNGGRRHGEQRGSGSQGGAVAAEIAGGGGFEGVVGRLLPATWVQAWRSVPVEEEPACRRTMARAVFRSGEHKSISGGSEDGVAAIRARTDCSGATGDVGATAFAIASGERPSS